jgi:hypothetical protein
MHCLCVDPDRIDEIWPHVESFIASALWRSPDGDTPADTLYELHDRSLLLWIVWASDEKEILAAATTRLIKIGKGLVCVITACGGRDLKRWKWSIDEIEKYALAEGCVELRLMGRKGWVRMLHGFREPWSVLVKELSA